MSSRDHGDPVLVLAELAGSGQGRSRSRVLHLGVRYEFVGQVREIARQGHDPREKILAERIVALRT